jgi:serine/threonine-protein kinase RsbW
VSPVPAAAPRLQLDFSSSGEAIARAREDVRTLLERHQVDGRARYAVELALEELLANIARHGYGLGSPGAVRLTVEIEVPRIRLTIHDDARAFDPTRHPEPARLRSVEEAPIGGRGISMVRAAVSGMRYRREAGANCLELEVARAPRES